MRAGVLLAILVAAPPAYASHDWLGIDLCTERREVMPPEPAPGGLAGADGEGAGLVRRYCAQCHHPPGPGQHTAAEWAQVLPRMRLLAEVTARFGMGAGDVAIPGDDEYAALERYLRRGALVPLGAGHRDDVPPEYEAACGDCHRPPDPAHYGAADWQAVMARMDGYRGQMARPPLPRAAAGAILDFLDRYTAEGVTATSGAPEGRGTGGSRTGSWIALGPFFVLMLVGAYRLHRGRMRGRR
jgi:hypothetical protein